MSSPSRPARRRLFAVAVAVLVAALAAGCSGDANADSGGSTHPSGIPARQPAALSGGACQLLDYDVVEAVIGVRFAVAAAASSAATFTCVLQPDGAGLPDLSLAVTATEADNSVFRSTVIPKGATTLEDLGKLGYRVGVPGSAAAGPGVEVGWLSGNQRLMVLRFHSATGTAAGDVDALAPKLVDLAKKIDLTTS
jgi:hypothetical protein